MFTPPSIFYENAIALNPEYYFTKRNVVNLFFYDIACFAGFVSYIYMSIFGSVNDKRW